MFRLNEVKYKDILNIDDLTIEQGKITCIVGESGAGKSTLLKLLNKMISPDEGEIVYKDKKLKDYDAVALRKSVIYLSQKPYIYKKTIKDNLMKAASFHRLNVTDETMEKMLKQVKLTQSLDHDARKLSGGEAQRLALARVMLLKGEVYIMDEPSSALDDETEDLVISMIVDFVKKNQLSLVMITHSKAVAKKYGDILIEIAKGEVKGVESLE